jgi:hypothetical protein
MLKLVFISFLFISLNGLSQDQVCVCATDSSLSRTEPSCDTTHFSNGAKLYYSWNCDSTWLTFENKEKVILKPCMAMRPLCTRVGLTFINEYPTHLLFTYSWVSGCCDPPDLVFIDKESGLEQKRISKNLFVWGEADGAYSLYFENSTLTNLVFYNHQKDSYSYLSFEEGEVNRSMSSMGAMFFTKIFKEFSLSTDGLHFEFTNAEGVVEKRVVLFE